LAYDRKDAFHARAKREGYASRAAYKLQELQQRARLLRPGQRVADLGCWPGGWLQVAAECVGAKGRVVGVDLAAIEPPLPNANVIAFVGDLSDPSVSQRILAELGGPADVVLSDAAPKLTGIRDADRAREEGLLGALEARIPELLRPGGAALVKLLDCPEAAAFKKRLARRFETSQLTTTEATRRGSTERYLILRAFKKGTATGAP
jgi:23S rRNA (uridine2552-2'-O)-methyltransferase